MSSEELTDDTFYSEGKRSGKLLGLHCENGHFTLPPRHSCMMCSSSKLQVVELSRRGKIISFTRIFSKSKDFPIEAPYFLLLVKLVEGPNLLGILDDESKKNSDKLKIGAEVTVLFRNLSEKEPPRIFFEITV